MKLVNDQQAVKVSLTAPTVNGFLVLAAEVGRWVGPLPLPSRVRDRLLDRVTILCESSRTVPTSPRHRVSGSPPPARRRARKSCTELASGLPATTSSSWCAQ